MKFGLHSAAEALRHELHGCGIRVTLIEPGIVHSKFQQVVGCDSKWFQEFSNSIGQLIEPDDIARAKTFVVAQPCISISTIWLFALPGKIIPDYKLLGTILIWSLTNTHFEHQPG
jgi:NADP-dependent 3-hydroxy acid dehydrogenase YdfG